MLKNPASREGWPGESSPVLAQRAA